MLTEGEKLSRRAVPSAGLRRLRGNSSTPYRST